ncbi:MAG TPA: hypothetical protein VK158_03165 [Acidobacteriota bacterium]|nr:hypothetical protein [Acidobacteriota bacterium]
MMRKNNRKGQAAVEFLMTYGWAFSIILLTLGVLVYSGVFDLDSFVNEKCEFYSGIICVDARANQTGVILSIQNGLPIDLTNVQVTIDKCANALGPATLAPGDLGNYTATCTLPNAVFRSGIQLNYTNPDSLLNHTKVGVVVYKVN